jgi:hypothetical protein
VGDEGSQFVAGKQIGRPHTDNQFAHPEPHPPHHFRGVPQPDPVRDWHIQ